MPSRLPEPHTPPPADPLLRAEQDVRAKLQDHELDLSSLLAISNIYRAAAAVRRRAEREVFASTSLSWGGFTILWVLWVWGEMETAKLAAECDLAKGTLTGMLKTLEGRDWVTRTRVESDRRRVMVALTPEGEATIADLFPRFNRFEGQMSGGLSEREKQELARLLRAVIVNAEDEKAT